MGKRESRSQKKITKKIKRGSYGSKVKRLTKGLFNSLTDTCLFTLFFYLQSYQVAYGRGSIREAIDKSIHLTKIVNPHNLDRLIYRLKNRGYLEKKKDYLKITDLGRKRLERTIPIYEKKRPWDGIIYLITYDIPKEKKRDRDSLRDCLKRLGAGLLQKSVWLTPYNPKSLIIDFIKEKGLFSLILVSELKEGSYIGGENIQDALSRVYQLEKLNEEYKNFINRVNSGKLMGIQLMIAYLSILKKDPQLPFRLLPDCWLGEEAYDCCKEVLKKSNKA